MTCQPLGLPRQGPPRSIYQTANEITWRGGFFHTHQMHVVERFTRQGHTVLYEVTVEDPEVLVEPWVLAPRTLVPNTNPKAGLLPERGNCEVYEDAAGTNQIRH